VDSSGSAYVTGGTGSLDFPTADAIQSTFGGGSCSFQSGGVTYPVSCPNAFLTKLKPDGTGVIYSTYHGGAGGDIGFGVALDANNAAYIAGTSVSSDFPMANPYQTNLAGLSDAFVSKITFGRPFLPFQPHKDRKHWPPEP
jgi:hypothetical protein